MNETVRMDTLNVTTERMEDGRYFAECSETPGCWGEGPTIVAALDNYCSVLRAWWALKVEDGDDDLPPADLTWSATFLLAPPLSLRVQ